MTRWMDRAEHHRIVFALRKEITELKAEVEKLKARDVKGEPK